jgi:hypothetical protein
MIVGYQNGDGSVIHSYTCLEVIKDGSSFLQLAL